MRVALAFVLVCTSCGSPPESKAPDSHCSNLVLAAQNAVSKLAQKSKLERLARELNTELSLLNLPDGSCATPTLKRNATRLWLTSTFEAWDPCQMLKVEAVQTIHDLAASGKTLTLYHGAMALEDLRAVSKICEGEPSMAFIDPVPYRAAVRARTLLALGIVPAGQISSPPDSPDQWVDSFLARTRDFWLHLSRDGFVSATREWPLSEQCVKPKSDTSSLTGTESGTTCIDDVAKFEERFMSPEMEHPIDRRHLEAYAESARDIRVRFVAFVLLGDLLLGDGEIAQANLMYAKAIEPARNPDALQLLERHRLYAAVKNRLTGVAPP